MPPGRTGGGYSAPTLTEEEAAALAAEQAAAYGSDYAPAEPPPAEPVAAPAPQTEMYQPSSPPPAETAPAAPVETGGGGYASEPYGGNDRISPMPSSQGSGYYTSSPEPYQPAQPAPAWQSVSPQVNDSQFALTPSEARDPLRGGQTIPYQPSEMAASNTAFQAQQDASASAANRAGPVSGGSHGPDDGMAAPRPNTQGRGTLRVGTLDQAGQDAARNALGLDRDPNRPSPVGLPKAGVAGGLSAPYAGEVAPLQGEGAGHGGSPGDMLARALGGNPDDSDDNLYQQFVNSMYRQGGDVLGRSLRFGGDVLGGTAQVGANVLGTTLQAEKDKWLDPFLNADDSAGAIWNAAEAVIGPHGTGLRQAQSTFDPLGRALAESVADPLGSAKDGVGAAKDDFFNFAGTAKDAALDGAQRTSDQAVTGAEDVTGGRRSLGDAIRDFSSFPLPSFGLPTPQPRDVDLQEPNLSWLLMPGAVAREAGFELGQQGRRLVEDARAKSDQIARGESLRDRLNGTSSVSAAREAVQNADLPSIDIPGVTLSDYLPSDPDATGDPALMQQARDAATAAKNWAAGINLPDMGVSIRYPSGQPTVGDGAPLPVRRTPMPPLTVEDGSQLIVRRTRPVEGIDPNALYMPEAPPPTLTDRARNAVQGLADRLPDVILPSIDIPGRNTIPNGGESFDGPDLGFLWDESKAGPGTGGSSSGATPSTDPLQQAFTEQQTGATRSATQPEGTSVAQEAGASWIKDANGNYVGLVDPATGEFVMLPANATNEEKQAIVNGILTASTQSAAPGPATTAPATATPASTSTGNSNSGPTTSGNSGNGSGGGSTSSGTSTVQKSRSSDYGDDDNDAAPLNLEDFIQDFDGDGTISKRDRMQGKRAFEEAKAARSKKRRGKTTSRKANTGFPFDRQPSPIRQQVLGAIAESQGRQR